MQSGISKGRNSLLENIWRSVSGFTRTFFQGQQRPRAATAIASSLNPRGYDLEISEHPVRDAGRARELIELCEWCPEVATAIDILTGDSLQSEDGDDCGFTIGDTLNDGVTPVDPEVQRIGNELIARVIGGSSLEPAIERFLSYGDAFANISIDTRRSQINSILFLPTWEMFRVEEQGQLLAFEQRQRIYDSDPIRMHPVTVVQWRYRRKFLYGRSLFNESLADWAKLKDATSDLAQAGRAIGYNPNVHIMPPDASPEYKDAYREDYEARLADGLITDFYLLPGAEVRKLAQANPDLKALADNVLLWRSRIGMRSRVPPWMLGLPTTGAKDIQGGPERAYARLVNRIRGVLTEGVKQIINTELALKDIPPNRWLYRVQFPIIYTNPQQQAIAMSDEGSAIEDLDSKQVLTYR